MAPPPTRDLVQTTTDRESAVRTVKSAELVGSIVQDFFGREVEEARQAGRIGYVARLTVQVTLPHSRRKEPYQERRNGPLTVTMMAPPSIGLPYGSLARLVLSWVTTEAVRTKSPHLTLGPTLSAYLADVGVSRSGGPSGSYTRARNQIVRLFSTSISCSHSGPDHIALRNTPVAAGAQLWWDPKQPAQPVLFESSVTLNQDFYEDVIQHPIPIDKGTLRALARSPMAIDFYTWLTYRMSYLKQPTVVPWEALRAQFGADYTDSRDFRKKARAALRQVTREYPAVALTDGRRGLELRPSPTHIRLLPGADCQLQESWAISVAFTAITTGTPRTRARCAPPPPPGAPR